MRTLIYGLILLVITICVIFFVLFKFNSSRIENELAQSKNEFVVKPTQKKPQDSETATPSNESIANAKNN